LLLPQSAGKAIELSGNEGWFGVDSSLKRILIAVAAGVFLSGCSETGFKDVMGYAKYSPDETQVRQNASLVMPPSLELRAPVGGQAPAEPALANSIVPSQQVSPNPPQYGTPDPNAVPSYQAAYNDPQAPATLQEPATLQTPQPAPETQDVYAKWGISKYHPDGTPKSKGELVNDLRKKRIEIERQKNPNYGTVANSGGFWGSGSILGGIFGD
jgi:hypothetical protein